MIRLGLVVPCFNEEEVLPETAKQLLEILDKLVVRQIISLNSFILFVDDGSKDSTWNIIKDLHTNSDNIYGLKLSVNVGHQNALLSGLMTAKELADVVISIDADLQDDVEVIEDMLNEYIAGYEIVYGVRDSRKTDSLSKRVTARMFYKFMAFLGTKTVYNHSDYRLMSKKALDVLSKFEERNLYLRGLIPLIGFSSTTVYYDRKLRFAGKSKYPFGKMVNLAVNGITSFSIKPLRMIFALGFMILILSFLALAYIIYSYVSGRAIPGWSSLILSIWFLGAVVLISIGILGEYIGKIYIETKHRPRFSIDTFLSHEDNK